MSKHRSLVIVLCLALTNALGAAPPAFYLSDFAAGESGFRTIYHYYGKSDLSIDREKPGPSGGPSLRTTLTGKTKTMAGINLPVPPGQRVRIALAGAAALSVCDKINVAVKCITDGGDVWLDVGAFPRTRAFGLVSSGIMEIPSATQRAYLFVFAQDATGVFWVADLSVRPADVPPELEAQFDAKGPTVWGINDPLVLAYHEKPDATLSDTSAKLMAAVGFRVARLWTWWGSRDQFKYDINQGGAWLMLDRTKGEYDFSPLAQRLDQLAYYGLAPGPVIVNGTPVWASGKTVADLPVDAPGKWRARRRPFWPPRDWAEYDRFVFELASRFKGRVRTWEVMNEANTPDSGLQGGHRMYAEYLRRFHAAAKRADAGCTVLCGRIGGDWLGRMVAETPRIVDSFDGMVCHPYAGTAEGSLAMVRRLQFAMAGLGFVKPIYITEFNFFGGKWQDDKPGDVLQREMAGRIRAGAPLMAKVSDSVSWWNATFKTHRHGLLRDEDVCLRPLLQFWEFGKVTGRLTPGGGPVKARVEIVAAGVDAAGQTDVRLVATNASDQPQAIRFWPVGFVTALGMSTDDVRAYDWQGTLAPGAQHTVTIRVRPTPAAAKHTMPLGLAIINAQGNAVAMRDLVVP